MQHYCPGESITIRIHLLNREKYSGIRVSERAFSYTSCNMAGWQKKYTKAVTTNIEKFVFSRFRLYFSHLREYSTFILGM